MGLIMYRKAVVLCVVPLGLMGTPLLGKAEAAVIKVDVDSPAQNPDGSSWESAYQDLQDALAVGVPGDEIWVAQGTYKPTTGAGRGYSFALANGVAVYGGYAGYGETDPDARDPGTYVTILSGDIGTIGDSSDNTYHVVRSGNVDSATLLDGFTITGGNANGGDDASHGGAIFNAGDLQVLDCRFTQNTADIGGAIYNDGGVLPLIQPRVSGCTFDANSAAGTGGAIFNGGTNGVDIYVEHSAFIGNTAGTLSTGSGGAISNVGGALYLIHCDFEQNTVLGDDSDAGALMNTGTKAAVIDCLFDGNSCPGEFTAGGAVDNVAGEGVFDPTEFPVDYVNCVFVNNSASRGGAVGNQSVYGSFTNCKFKSNHADTSPYYEGGAMEASSWRGWCELRLVNCTFNSNSAQGGGGALWASGVDTTVRLYNCILWGDSVGEIAVDGATVEASRSDIAGDWPGDNDDVDPLFVDGGLHLSVNSPCIDVGNNGYLPADTFDLDGDGDYGEDIPYFLGGNPRKVDGDGDQVVTVDQGAYEYKPCAGDLDGDGKTTQADLGILQTAWANGDGSGDLDGDWDTDQGDLGVLLSNFPCSP